MRQFSGVIFTSYPVVWIPPQSFTDISLGGIFWIVYDVTSQFSNTQIHCPLWVGSSYVFGHQYVCSLFCCTLCCQVYTLEYLCFAVSWINLYRIILDRISQHNGAVSQSRQTLWYTSSNYWIRMNHRLITWPFARWIGRRCMGNQLSLFDSKYLFVYFMHSIPLSSAQTYSNSIHYTYSQEVFSYDTISQDKSNFFHV